MSISNKQYVRQKQKVTVQKRLFIFYIRSKYAYFKYRTIFFYDTDNLSDI